MIADACRNTELAVSPGGLLAVAVALGVVGLAAWMARRHPFPGDGAFRWMQWAALGWLGAKGVELTVVAPACKMLWAAHAWPAIMATPTLWAVFLWRYTHPAAEPLRAPVRIGLGLAPVAMWLLAITNSSHGLLYAPGSGPVGSEPGAPVRYLHGPAFWLAAAYVYTLTAAAVAAVARAAAASQGALRRLYVGLLAVTFVPWAANVSYVAFGVKLLGAEPTPYSFALAMALIAWAIRRWHLFDLKPVARGALLDALPDPVIVLDAAGRIVETNPAARRLAGARATGQPLAQWSRVGEALARALGPGAPGGDVHLAGQVYEIQCAALGDAHRPLGTLVYLRDVTQRHHAQARLAEALAERDRQVHAVTHLHRAMQEQALRDPLTGLHNRRALEAFFERESEQAARDGRPLCVALVDLDHFKRINDTHGHAIGDEVLTGLAQRLRRRARASDGVFRFGGEEFLLVLPDTGLHDAGRSLEALCRAVRARPVETAAGPLACTMSVGAAQWAGSGQPLNALLQAADRALYRAKAAGRDRVELTDRTCGPTGCGPQADFDAQADFGAQAGCRAQAGFGAQAGCRNEAGCHPYGTQREPGAACAQADCSCASAYS